MTHHHGDHVVGVGRDGRYAVGVPLLRWPGWPTGRSRRRATCGSTPSTRRATPPTTSASSSTARVLHRRRPVRRLGRRRRGGGANGYEDLRRSIDALEARPGRACTPATRDLHRREEWATTRSSGSGEGWVRRAPRPARCAGAGHAHPVGPRLRRRPQGLGALSGRS